jgi:DNA-binding CsgD family transcriptional regulator
MPRETNPGGQRRLTTAEEEVLRLIVERLTDSEIAEIRVVSIWTVKTQVRSILDKLGVRTRREAARLYQRSP